MLRTVQGRWGPCTVFEKDEYIGRSVIAYGEYGPDETEKILELAGDGWCVDIGANVGCIAQALLCRGRRVVAFEPQPELFKLLQANVASAGGGGVATAVCHNVALGAEPGRSIMPKVAYSERGNYGGIALGLRSARGHYEVPVATLDGFGLEGVSFVKIDVEGHEAQVLLGARNTIARDRPVLYLEDDRAAKSAALRRLIDELGYDIEEHKPPIFRPTNHFGNERNIWGAAYVSHNLICRPR